MVEADACMQREHQEAFSQLLSNLVDSDDIPANHIDGANMLLTNTLPLSSPSFRNKQRQTIFCSATIPQPRHFRNNVFNNNGPCESQCFSIPCSLFLLGRRKEETKDRTMALATAIPCFRPHPFCR
jgi:hypothetical protein